MHEEWRAYWRERAARQGPSYVGPGGHPEKSDEEGRRIRSWLSEAVPECETLLDFGCGPGRLTDTLAAKAEEYVGVDIVPDSIGQHATADNVTFLPLTDNEFPLENDTMDVVVAVLVLQHIVETRDFALWCSEIGRVLRPGGVLVVWDHETQPDMDPHMNPRGSEAIAEAVGVRPFKVARGWGHWAGVARHE